MFWLEKTKKLTNFIILQIWEILKHFIKLCLGGCKLKHGLKKMPMVKKVPRIDTWKVITQNARNWKNQTCDWVKYFNKPHLARKNPITCHTLLDKHKPLQLCMWPKSSSVITLNQKPIKVWSRIGIKSKHFTSTVWFFNFHFLLYILQLKFQFYTLQTLLYTW